VKMEEESKFKPSIALCEVVQGHDYTYLWFIVSLI
jgi:hypothetical protein